MCNNFYIVIYLVDLCVESVVKMYAIRRYSNVKQFAKFKQFGRLTNIGQCLSSNESTKRTFYTYSPEPSQPINRDPTFCSIEDAVKCVKSGIILSMMCLFCFPFFLLLNLITCIICWKLLKIPILYSRKI